MSKLDDVEMSPDEIQALTQTEEYLAFYDDVVQNYAIAFSFNPNFKEDFIESNSCTWTPMGNSTLTYNNIPFPCDGIWFQLYSQENKYDFKYNEIVLLYSDYNEIFGNNYNTQSMSTFIPHKATFTYYYYFDKMRMYVVDSFEVEIIAISNDRSYAAEEAFERVQSLNTYTNSLYFNNQEEIEIIFNTANELGYEPNSIVAYSLATMTKAVNIFSEFFVIIFVGLCVCSFIILINYGIKLVKERKYEIGILKALGIKEFDLFIIIGLQMILLILLVIAMYILGSILFIDLSNDILVRSLLELAPNHFLMDIDVLYLKTNYILENSLLVILIVSLSFVIPLFKLKFLKPTNIIKAKE